MNIASQEVDEKENQAALKLARDRRAKIVKNLDEEMYRLGMMASRERFVFAVILARIIDGEKFDE